MEINEPQQPDFPGDSNSLFFFGSGRQGESSEFGRRKFLLRKTNMETEKVHPCNSKKHLQSTNLGGLQLCLPPLNISATFAEAPQKGKHSHSNLSPNCHHRSGVNLLLVLGSVVS